MAEGKVQTKRKGAAFLDYHENYLVRDRTFSKQFSACYAARTKVLAPAVHKNLPVDLQREVQRVAGLRDDGSTQVLVGTLVKIAKRLPNLLTEYAADRVIFGFKWQRGTVYVDPEDEIYIEDASGRIRLAFGEPSKHEEGSEQPQKDDAAMTDDGDDEWATHACEQYTTGVVVGVSGTYDSRNNVFIVPRKDCLHFASAGVRVIEDGSDDKTVLNAAVATKGKFVLLASGLKLGDQNSNPLCVHMLTEWLSGNIGGEEDKQIAASVVHVVLAGDSVVCLATSGGYHASDTQSSATVSESRRNTTIFAGTLLELENVLTSICSSCPVDIMPGPCDPANNALPQQPMEKFVLKMYLLLFFVVLTCFCIQSFVPNNFTICFMSPGNKSSFDVC